jgi:hypothetical protein
MTFCNPMVRKILTLLWLPLLVAGCATKLTNLTPQQQTRNADNLYPVEVAFKTRQQSLRWETVRPSVIVGSEFYPMRPTLLMTNRWETLIPMPPNTNFVYYQFKLDFDYQTMRERRADSVLSSVYTLQLLDK